MQDVGKMFGVACVSLALINLPVSAKLKKRGLSPGLWGGEHISLKVSAKGAQVEYDCAHASIDRAIVLDQNGHFNVSGRQFQERGGPVRRGAPSSYPVIFSGEVKDQTMTLTVKNSSTNEEIGTFTLVHGAQPRLFKCK